MGNRDHGIRDHHHGPDVKDHGHGLKENGVGRIDHSICDEQSFANPKLVVFGVPARSHHY
jgi:hypothetical protein